MRLDFNVLWVEDQRNNVESQRIKIDWQLKKEGFRLQVIFAASVLEAMKYLSEDIYGDHIDLILMDYDLGAGKKGDQGLVEVKSKFQYKDVIFYSAQAIDMSKIVANTNVQGIYWAARDELPVRVEGIFETLVKKVLDIEQSRGIIMGATSDIDYHVSNCLISIFDIGDLKHQEDTLKIVADNLKDICKRFEEEASKISAIKHVSELLDKNFVYTSYDRLRLLKKALKNAGIYPEKEKKIGKYLSDIIEKRNILAHHRVTIDGFSRKLIDRKGREWTSEDMRSLRLKLVEHQELFEELFRDLKKGQA